MPLSVNKSSISRKLNVKVGRDSTGQAACQEGLPVGFFTAAALVHEFIEVRGAKRLLRLLSQLSVHELLVVDELVYLPRSQTGSELPFEIFSRRCDRDSTIVTCILPFDAWTSVFGAERLTGIPLDRLTLCA